MIKKKMLRLNSTRLSRRLPQLFSVLKIIDKILEEKLRDISRLEMCSLTLSLRWLG